MSKFRKIIKKSQNKLKIQIKIKKINFKFICLIFTAEEKFSKFFDKNIFFENKVEIFG